MNVNVPPPPQPYIEMAQSIAFGMSPKTAEEYFKVVAALNLLNQVANLSSKKILLSKKEIQSRIIEVAEAVVNCHNPNVDTMIVSRNTILFRIFSKVFSFHDIPIHPLIRSTTAPDVRNISIWKILEVKGNPIEILEAAMKVENKSDISRTDEQHDKNLEKPTEPSSSVTNESSTANAKIESEQVSSSLDAKDKLSKILAILRDGLYEREEIIGIAFLASIAGQNIFLYGPPGTAKSLLARRISRVFLSDNYFEYLMQRFSTPEEIFGPISIAELKGDKYVRKTNGYLPEANFAFLDEIWKSSPAILNALLTIINEKKFKNGDQVINVPLHSIISASNETPPDNQGLEALYDRFLLRMYVPPISSIKNFEALLQNGAAMDKIEIPSALKISNDELNQWQKQICDTKISRETMLLICEIKSAIEKDASDGKLNVYVSDRRWQRAAQLLKANAFFSGRSQTDPTDCHLLRHCLWTTPQNRIPIQKLVDSALQGTTSDVDIKQQLEDLIAEIKSHTYQENTVKKNHIIKYDGNDYCQYEFPENYRQSYLGSNLNPNYIPFKSILLPIKTMFSGQVFYASIKSSYYSNVELLDKNSYRGTIAAKHIEKGEFDIAYVDRNGKNVNLTITVPISQEKGKLDKAVHPEELETRIKVIKWSAAKVIKHCNQVIKSDSVSIFFSLSTGAFNQMIDDMKIIKTECDNLLKKISNNDGVL